MKKMCLYFLIIQIAAYTTGMHELIKVPVFVRHYSEHKKSDTTKGIIDFIAMHYLGHDKNDNDDARDNALPFKNYHHQSHPNLLFIPFNHQYLVFTSFTYKTKANPYLLHGIVPPYPALPLRPPCTA